ncbi:PVC-type heme-binding CxxCH protein [Agaribacter marinus]|uniref:Dehydrogenase n=1 Tax=Agaribacter marinus TaxID=1431249 RepID=A0AA37STJ2_9ALTE|nr:PVC-type heme-binding CxxCH protein [Agaribacter marinus]GLR69621.1 dehydrogenase [Agaribacter marinus]
MKKNFIVLSVIALVSAGLFAADSEHKNKGDRPGHVMKDVIPKDQIPPSPVLNVAQALKSFVVQDGFAIENVVSEPNVFNPVAMVFDANGRMWVAEMTRYMPDTKGTGEFVPEGNIAILEDQNGDGKVDKRTVFLNDIILPRTISLVKGGIFYADHTQLFFTEVIEKDGEIRPGMREVVDPTYAKGGNLEHKPNTMLYGMDDWYYNAKSNIKYKVLPLTEEVPVNAEEIYTNKYWKLVRAKGAWRGQWGVSMDDYGRLYHNGNSSPLSGEYMMPGTLLNNPEFWPKTPAKRVGSNTIYSVRMNPGVNRGYMENTLVQDKGENWGKLKGFTAASGSVVYRGDNFPAKYYGIGITPEPAGNLISARYIQEKKGEISGSLVFPKAEILASTDERFRPVNLYTAPDGSLYLLDMYHGILQHKEFMTTYLSDQIHARDLDKNNNTMGRIYRLRYKGRPLGEQPRLVDLSNAELIAHLGHKNGWWRDAARRLLVQNADASVVPAIKKLMFDTHDHIVKINALWTIHGLKGIDLKTAMHALSSDNTKVKIAAVATATQLPTINHQVFVDALIDEMKGNFELSINASAYAFAFNTPSKFNISTYTLQEFSDFPLVIEAVASGLGSDSKTFLDLHDGEFPNSTFMNIMHNLGKRPEERTNREQLSALGKKLYDDGKALYNGQAGCFGCHGVNGDGVDGLGPTFWKSEWVIDSKDKLNKVLLHGLSGPIWVNRRLINTPAVMPGLANHPSIGDKELAAISTYIRNSWGNSADIDGHVSADDVKKVREETKDRQTPYTQKDF